MQSKIKTVSESVASREKAPKGVKRVAPNKVPLSRMKFAWLTPSARVRESRERGVDLLHVLSEQIKYYCSNSSLVGYKYIAEIRRTWFERVMWIVLHLVMIFIMGAIVWKVLQDYKNMPVVTGLESDHYPSKLLIFPAVSVCSINRISRKAAEKLARQIESSNVTSLSYEKILNLLKRLGGLYLMSTSTPRDVHYKNQYELDSLLKKFFNGTFQLAQLMKKLSPQCEDMFIICYFRFSLKNCTELFDFRKTQDGFCCTFNYARLRDDIGGSIMDNPLNDPYKVEQTGELTGLTFLMEPHLDDYFFSILPVQGWKITIFNPTSYPDNTSGSVLYALISPRTENFLELSANSLNSENAIRRFSIDQRKCVFLDETKALFDGYTYSDCIVDCKVDDIWRLCNCRPFFYPMRYARRDCNTSDIECLQKYRVKWRSVLPNNIKKEDESKIFDDVKNESWSLRCKHCYPSCSDVRYYLQSSSLALKANSRHKFLNDTEIVNQSLVHVFFSNYRTVRLKQDITYYWYELLSNIGGLCGLFMGFSLLSAVEFIYFCLLSIVTLWLNISGKSTTEISTNTTANNDGPFYWSELMPRGKFNREKNTYSRRPVFQN